jgi:hypothetical protein
MNTDRLNRWLALGANVGVLIGLILLVYEVRQNSELMQAQISMERANMRRSLHRFYELRISFTRSKSSFIATMQELAREVGLPEIGDDGSWQ